MVLLLSRAQVVDSPVSTVGVGARTAPHGVRTVQEGIEGGRWAPCWKAVTVLPDPVYGRFGVTVYPGDCRDVLPALPDSSVDAVVTDPPYELGFMGKGWDSTGVAYDVTMWRQCLRVLKPGGHLLAFGGTRTWHRLVCAVEDAGFEIRDSIAWMYATGFPKSLDVSKAIDKVRDDRGDTLRVTGWLSQQRDRAGLTNRQIDEAFGFSGMAGHWTATPHNKVALVPRWDQWERLRELLGFGDEMDAEVWRLNGRKGTPGNERPDRDVGPKSGHVFGEGRSVRHAGTPVLDDARQWQGWGTALKPAFEPIVVARKPPAGTVAANVLEYGAGALNIDGCRVGSASTRRSNAAVMGYHGGNLATSYETGSDSGRWPTNVVLTHAATADGVDLCVDGCVPGCVRAELDEQAGERVSGSRRAGDFGLMGYHGADVAPMPAVEGDRGGASRFFPVFRFEAKAPGSERPRVDGVAHPTVKPLALLRWLVRLVTPPRGIVLDPFAGTGVTGQACRAENMACTLIERDKESIPLIHARLDRQPTGNGKRATATNPAAQFDLFSTEDV